MKKTTTVSPVLIELILVILFFALSSQAMLQLIAAAANMSRESERKSEAMIAAMDIMEAVRMDPDAPVDAPQITTRAGEPITFAVSVQERAAGAGVLYEIEVSALSGGESLLHLTDTRYVPGEAAG